MILAFSTMRLAVTLFNVVSVPDLEEENRLIEAGFEYVRYSGKDEVAIYRKRK
jgi:hypothetical protein